MVIAIAVVTTIVVLVLILALLKSPRFQIERSIEIAAPKPVVFDLVNDFRSWQHWSPWANLDPQMSVTYTGPASGGGAMYEWKGNKKVGSGKMTIVDATSHSRIGIKIEFIAPFPAKNDIAFQFEGTTATKVTWAMTGNHAFVARIFSLFFSFDKMLGKDFDKGLTALKQTAESKQL